MSSLTIDYCIQETSRSREHEHTITPSLLDAILSFDTYLTLKLAVCASPRTYIQRFLRYSCYILEITGHGAFWFAFCGLLGILYVLTRERALFVYCFNIFFILIIDIIVVAPVKLYFQRPRPSLNKGKIALSVSSVDKYSFPSGHTSRCISLATLFCYMLPFQLHTNMFCIWSILVCISRVLIGRHHISDVLVGVLAGFVIFEIALQTRLILT